MKKTKQEKIGLAKKQVKEPRLNYPKRTKPDSSETKVNVKEGMIWYHDDTFSFELIVGKQVKAVVELVEDGYVYGDLTAGDVFIPETGTYRILCPYNKDVLCRYSKRKNEKKTIVSVNDVIKRCCYKCKGKEKYVCYSFAQLKAVRDHYDAIANALTKLSKKTRRDVGIGYWTSDGNAGYMRIVPFKKGMPEEAWRSTLLNAYYRPVIMMKVD